MALQAVGLNVSVVSFLILTALQLPNANSAAAGGVAVASEHVELSGKAVKVATAEMLGCNKHARPDTTLRNRQIPGKSTQAARFLAVDYHGSHAEMLSCDG